MANEGLVTFKNGSTLYFLPCTEDEKRVWKALNDIQDVKLDLYERQSINSLYQDVVSGNTRKSLNLREHIWTILALGWRSLRVSLTRFWN